MNEDHHQDQHSALISSLTSMVENLSVLPLLSCLSIAVCPKLIVQGKQGSSWPETACQYSMQMMQDDMYVFGKNNQNCLVISQPKWSW